MSCGARAGGGIAFTLPTGTVNQAYSFDLTTMPNAVTNTQFTTQGVNNFGALPPGLSFVNGTSTIFGTPTTAGTYAPAFVVRGVQIAFQYVLSFQFLAASPSTGGGSSIVVPPPGSAGTVVLASNLTSGTVFTGGTLMTTNGLTSSASFVLGTGGAIVVTPPSGTGTLSGVISGSGGMTVASGASASSSTCLFCSGGILGGAGTGGLSSAVSTGSYQTSAGQTLNLPTLSGGTLILSGNNTYGGGTIVASGTLQVNGTSPTGLGDVTVNAGGMLMGTGTIAGNLNVGGILKPGNSPGYLAVSANVAMLSGSVYVQDIAGLVQASGTSPRGAAGYYSYLNSTAGQFVINPNVLLAPRLANLFSAGEPGYDTSIFVPELGNHFRMVTASGGVAGRFTAVIQPAQLSSGMQFIAFYNVNNSNSIDLATVPISYANTLDAEKDNAKSVARVLDQLLGVNQVNTATAAQDQLLYAASGQTAASLPAFAKALSGEVHAASVVVLPQAGQRLQQTVLARLSDYLMMPNLLNPALNNASSSGLISGSNPTGLPTTAVGSNPAVNPNASAHASASLVNANAWAEIAYQRGDRGGDSQASGYNSNLYQAVFGIDAYSNAELGLKLGGGLALSTTTVAANGGNSTIQQGSLFLYGKMPVMQEYVIDAMTSFGLSSTDLSRSDVTGLSGGFKNRAVMGNDWLASLGISRPFEYNELRVTPYLRFTYQSVTQSGYNEGGTAAALDIGRYTGNGVRGVAGIAVGSLNKDPLKDDYTYRTNIAIGADSQGLLNPALSTTLGGYSSSVSTPTVGAAFVQVGLYGTMKLSDNIYAYAGVSSEARRGQTLYGGSAGLRFAF
jgi:autotransporter-associated beta strand protein